MATLTKRGNAWQLNWHDENGQHRKTIGKVSTMTKREALGLMHAKELELANRSTAAPVRKKEIDVRAAFDAYIDHRTEHFPSSVQADRSYLGRTLVGQFDKAVHRLTAEWYLDFQKKLIKQRMRSTAKRYSDVMTSFLKWLDSGGYEIPDGIIGFKPAKILDSKPPLFYTADQLQQLYAANEARAAVWQLYANTGMRRTEGVMLEWTRVLDNALHIVSSSHNRTKSGKWRLVPLGPGARDAIEKLRLITGASKYVLPHARPDAYSRYAREDLANAGLDGSLHTLRHTFASHLVMQGVPLRAVQKILGHASIKTTEVYAHLAPDFLQDVVSNLTI